jgi:tetratricopeptide (TPR) repeat protein
VADVLKPSRVDKNVRWDELVYYVKTQAGWLDATFRVGGTPAVVKKFIANGYPVIVEKGLVIEENSTGWTGHYNLITGYDDTAQTWVAQDSWKGGNQVVSYADMNADWQSFNYLYILVYPAEDKEKILHLLGEDAEEPANREHALGIAQRETETDPNNSFAWMNLGSNLAYFERYSEAAEAFDTARSLGLPYRILWYQFTPYRAYYNVGRFQDVIDLADATLEKADNLEESYFWRGWARLSLGDRNAAIGDFRTALKYNPDYLDAQTALVTLGVSP